MEGCLGGFIDDEHVKVGASVATRLDIRMLKDPDGGAAHEIGGIQDQALNGGGARTQRFEEGFLRRGESRTPFVELLEQAIPLNSDEVLKLPRARLLGDISTVTDADRDH